jgi:hypothetical protein
MVFVTEVTMGLGPSLRKKQKAQGTCEDGRRQSCLPTALLLALPAPAYSDLKDKTETRVSGMMMGHSIFRNGKKLTTYCSQLLPSPNFIKTISIPFYWI